MGAKANIQEVDKFFNYFEYRDRRFILEPGDKFEVGWKNHIIYVPIGNTNRRLLPQDSFSWTSAKSMALPKKYYKLLAACDNKETKEVAYEYGSGKELRPIHTITKVEEVEFEKPTEELFYIGITSTQYLDRTDRELFSIRSGIIKKETAKQFLMQTDLVYQSRIRKTEVNRIMSPQRWGGGFVRHSDSFAVICKFDRMDEFRDQLYMKATAQVEAQMAKAKENLKLYNLLAVKNGYQLPEEYEN